MSETKRISGGWRAFSLAKESAYGTPATANSSMNFEGPPSDVAPNEALTDETEVTGYVEATKREILNWNLEGRHKQRALPHNIAFFAALVLGKATTDQPDAVNDPAVYRHWIERDIAGVALPSVTMVEFDGVAQKRYAGIFGKSLKLQGRRGKFLEMEAVFGGMGKEETSAIARPASATESYLRYGDVEFVRGGALSGTVSAGTLAATGGTSFKAVLRSFEYSVGNGAEPIYQMGDNSGFVSRVERGNRWSQGLGAEFEMTDDAHKTALRDGAEYVLSIPIVGSAISGGSGNLKYAVELIFPKAVYKEARKDRDGDVAIVKAEFQVLEDPAYGSAIVKIVNKQTGYLV
ncbi:MAG: hypothetical protein HZA02_03155 [Nitrospinae bacterium]|nr:hypothetical protein [Nitrospinota bacterium]